MALAPVVIHPSLPALSRGQRWRFRDGREGVVAGVNAFAVTVYVGPQAHSIPVTDLRYAFDGASVVDPAPPRDEPVEVRSIPPDEVLPAVEALLVATASPDPPPPASAPEVIVVETEPSREDSPAPLPAVVEANAPASSVVTPVATTPSHGARGRGAGSGRRDRKRDPQV
mgnify:CR=1 FL=1